MADEQWPPNSGVPEKKRFKKSRGLKWGETPFDDLTRAELLRLVQAYHSALIATDSTLHMCSFNNEQSPFWGPGGTGGRALAKSSYLLALAGQDDPEPASEKIYRMFFRTADVLLFPHLRNAPNRFGDWGVNDKGEMRAPHKAEEGYRPIEWRDMLPQRS
jgi:hypothetical protein